MVAAPLLDAKNAKLILANPQQNSATAVGTTHSLRYAKYNARPSANSASIASSVADENVVNELLPVHKLECAMFRLVAIQGSSWAAFRKRVRPMEASGVAVRLWYRIRLRAYQGPASNATGAS